MEINNISEEIHKNAIAKGFWEDKSVAVKLALVHSEVSEEHYVKDSFGAEIAGTIIRCLDLCKFLGIDIQSHIECEHMYNLTTSY